MNNDIDNILLDQYVIIKKEPYDNDIGKEEKSPILDNLKLISYLKVGHFISSGVIIDSNTYFNRIWNYYTDYSKDTINFIKQAIDSAKEFSISTRHRYDENANCGRLNKQILDELINSLSVMKRFKETCNGDSISQMNLIISDLESYILFESVIADGYKIENNKVIISSLIMSYVVL